MQRKHNMRPSDLRIVITAAIAALASAASTLGVPAQVPPPGGQAFAITIDPAMWGLWDFQYPVTYVFEVSGLSPETGVRRRGHPTEIWTPIPQKAASECFNGVECVRFDRARHRAFVSVGFGAGNSIELQFSHAASARFVGVAKYYDDRTAAYTLSLDNWGRMATANPGATWQGPDSDRSDKYQAALAVCRRFSLPVSIAINTHMAGSNAMWRTMQQELDRGDLSWEPAVHAQTHPGNARAYGLRGRDAEILGCRDEILHSLRHIPFGQHVFEHILTSGYQDDAILGTDASEFLFVRGYNGGDNPASTTYANWDDAHKFYGVGGLSAKAYDRVFARRDPKGRFFAADVEELDAAFDRVREAGGICYAMWHPDRYQNSVIHDPRPGRDGVQGSTLMRHLAHVANRQDVWYVANGWLYCYRYVAEYATVTSQPSHSLKSPLEVTKKL